jgi:hypothetical protein
MIGAPEYFHANFTKYFTVEFWSEPSFACGYLRNKGFGMQTTVPIWLISMKEDSMIYVFAP